jgi:hypothetical protein
LCVRNGDLSFVSSVNCRWLSKTTWFTLGSLPTNVDPWHHIDSDGVVLYVCTEQPAEYQVLVDEMLLSKS